MQGLPGHGEELEFYFKGNGKILNIHEQGFDMLQISQLPVYDHCQSKIIPEKHLLLLH